MSPFFLSFLRRFIFIRVCLALLLLAGDDRPAKAQALPVFSPVAEAVGSLVEANLTAAGWTWVDAASLNALEATMEAVGASLATEGAEAGVVVAGAATAPAWLTFLAVAAAAAGGTWIIYKGYKWIFSDDKKSVLIVDLPDGVTDPVLSPGKIDTSSDVKVYDTYPYLGPERENVGPYGGISPLAYGPELLPPPGFSQNIYRVSDPVGTCEGNYKEVLSCLSLDIDKRIQAAWGTFYPPAWVQQPGVDPSVNPGIGLVRFDFTQGTCDEDGALVSPDSGCAVQLTLWKWTVGMDVYFWPVNVPNKCGQFMGCVSTVARPNTAGDGYQYWAQLDGFGHFFAPRIPGLTMEQAESNIPGRVQSQPIPAQELANIANRAWRDAASQPDYRGAPYPSDRPITADDVERWERANPDKVPKIGDALAPMWQPGQSVVPVRSPNAPGVGAPNPQADKGRCNGTHNCNKEIDLGVDPHVSSPSVEVSSATDILKPVTSLFPSLRSFVVPGHNGVCPAPVLSLFGSSLTFDFHCRVFDRIGSVVSVMCMVVWGFIAIRVFLRA